MTEFLSHIEVRRQAKDGWVVYTSSQLQGLFLASKDEKEIYDDLPDAISKLIKLDFGKTVTVAHHCKFEEFSMRNDLRDKAHRNVQLRTNGFCSESIDFTITEDILEDKIGHVR